LSGHARARAPAEACSSLREWGGRSCGLCLDGKCILIVLFLVAGGGVVHAFLVVCPLREPFLNLGILALKEHSLIVIYASLARTSNGQEFI
jgi:hypothetical protein